MKTFPLTTIEFIFSTRTIPLIVTFIVNGDACSIGTFKFGDIITCCKDKKYPIKKKDLWNARWKLNIESMPGKSFLHLFWKFDHDENSTELFEHFQNASVNALVKWDKFEFLNSANFLWETLKFLSLYENIFWDNILSISFCRHF